jgi:phospholipase/carboxylesterase
VPQRAAASVLLVGLVIAQAGSAQSPSARLTARPDEGGGACASGTHTLRLGPGRTALMRVTPGGGAGKALILVLHGAGGRAPDGLYAFRAALRRPGVVLVAPSSESRIWNPFYGSDLNSIDRALRRAFARCRVDPRRVGIGGFSDGAGNALTLGLSNGDLFRSVVALAPGGYLAVRPVGRPRVFVAHGTRDAVIPIGRAREIVRDLRSSGYAVTFRPFAGGHEVPEGISEAAVRWALRPG